MNFRRLFPGAAALAGALAFLPPVASRAAAPAARIVSVEEIKPQGRLAHFRGAGLSAFDEEPSMGDAGFSVRWYAAPPGAPGGTLLYAECLFARSQMPRTFFAPQHDATEGYRTSGIAVPGAMVARYGAITSWQVTLAYRGTVVDRWVSPAGWTPVGELPPVGMDAPQAVRPAPAVAPPRQRMTVQAGRVPVRQVPVAERSASVPAQPRPDAAPPPPAARPAAAAPQVRQPLAIQPSRPVPAAPASAAPAAPRRPANPDAPVGWSPASRPAPSAKPVPPKPVPAKPVASQPVAARPVTAQPASPKPVSVKPASAQTAGRPVGIRPSTPDVQTAPRSLP